MKSMNPLKRNMLAILLAAGLSQATQAGRINIVNLAHDGDLVVKIAYEKISQNLVVKPNSFSGAFTLPETEVTISAAMAEPVVIKIEPTLDPYLIVLKTDGKKASWQLVPSKPAGEEWAFRIINISKIPLPIINAEKQTQELAPGSDTAFSVKGAGQIRVQIPELEKFSYGGIEPSAVIAFAYQKADQWKVCFVPEF